MIRECLLLDLVDDADLIAAYRTWHAPGGVPAAVLAHIRQSGIVAMEIWNVADRLVMIVQRDETITAPGGAPPPDVARWEALMDRYQQRLPAADAGTKWLAAGKIFDLAEHAADQPG
jgi:L-rhamnose mutarotase